MSSNAENFYIFIGTVIGLAIAVMVFLKFYVQRSMSTIERRDGEHTTKH